LPESDDSSGVAFTGEFFVPGQTKKRIEADHRERYLFACQYAKGKRVLDIACGMGYAAPMLLEAGATSYTGADINPQLVELAQAAYGSDKASYTFGDITTFDPGSRFDLITCFETIEHVSAYDQAMARMFELLEPGGTLLISSPNRPIASPKAIHLTDKPKNKFHTQEFTPGELTAKLKEHGYAVASGAVFGQRQRTVFGFKPLNKLSKLLLGNPDSRTSPAVTALKNKTPRYFLVVATKPA